jgi:hypothetical protein
MQLPTSISQACKLSVVATNLLGNGLPLSTMFTSAAVKDLLGVPFAYLLRGTIHNLEG